MREREPRNLLLLAVVVGEGVQVARPHVLLLSSSSLISSLLHSHAILEWCDKIKLSNLLLPRKSGTFKSLQLSKSRDPTFSCRAFRGSSFPLLSGQVCTEDPICQLMNSRSELGFVSGPFRVSVSGFGFQVSCFGFQISDSFRVHLVFRVCMLRVSGSFRDRFRFRVSGFGSRVRCGFVSCFVCRGLFSVFRVPGSFRGRFGCQVSGLGFRFSGFGVRVDDKPGPWAAARTCASATYSPTKHRQQSHHQQQKVCCPKAKCPCGGDPPISLSLRRSLSRWGSGEGERREREARERETRGYEPFTHQNSVRGEGLASGTNTWGVWGGVIKGGGVQGAGP